MLIEQLANDLGELLRVRRSGQQIADMRVLRDHAGRRRDQRADPFLRIQPPGEDDDLLARLRDRPS